MTDRAVFNSGSLDRVKKFDTYDPKRSSKRHKISDFTVNNVKSTNGLPQNYIIKSLQEKNEYVNPVVDTKTKNEEEDKISVILDSINRETDKSDLKPPASYKKSSFSFSSFLVNLSYFFSLILFITGMSLSAKIFILDKQDTVLSQELDQQVEYDDQGVMLGTSLLPSADLPAQSAFFSHKTDDNEPRFIRIPKLSTYARIKALAAEGRYSPATRNIHDVGWLDSSANPGSVADTSLYFGHSRGEFMDGVFGKIHELVKDDIIEIETGDGDVVNYYVDTVEEIEAQPIETQHLLDSNTKKHQLRLVSSINNYSIDTSKNSTSHVVTAIRAN